jgi:alpha-N-arabinofuranosidase
MTSDTGCWPQATYWPFHYASKYGRGVSLGVELDVPAYEDSDYGPVDYLDATATYNEDAGEIAFFLVNRSTEESVVLDARLGGFDPKKIAEQVVMTSDDPKAVNDEKDPDRVKAVPSDAFSLDGDRLKGAVPPLSWMMARISV